MTHLVRYGQGRASIGTPAWFTERTRRAPFGTPGHGVQIAEDDGAITVTAEMPGVAEDTIEVTLDAGVLQMTGRRGERTYAYRCTLGPHVDPDTLGATIENGILTITGRTAAGGPRRIPVVVKGRRHGARRRFALFRKRG